MTAAAPLETIRFAGAPAAAQLRIEVRSERGALVYDSDWKDGSILDWLPRDGSGEKLGFGVYHLVMRSKNLAGHTSATEAVLHVNSDGMTVEDQPGATQMITLTAHDGEKGQLITTSGDLSFRFGDFLNQKDTEAMRLTRDGTLDVNGLIRTSKGIQFADGTILTTASGVAVAGDVMRQRPGTPKPVLAFKPPILPLNSSVPPNARAPRPNFAPAYQFVVGDNGVQVGTTNPAYNLDVTGIINTATKYSLGGMVFAHNHGTENTFLGVGAGYNTGGSIDNTGVGFLALDSVVNGMSNTAIGSYALDVLTSGNNNSAIGAQALANNVGDGNTAAGMQALSLATGNNNAALGYRAGFNLTAGDHNTLLGYNAGLNLTSGDLNIEIATVGVAVESNTTRIGNQQTRAFIAGVRGVTTDNSNAVQVMIDSLGQLGTISSSRRYKVDIADMDHATDDLMRLRPVTFRYLAHGADAPLQYGLVAEEVAEVYPELVARNKDGEVDTVMYQFLAPMLLNETQKQHRENQELQKTVGQQKKTIDALNTTLQGLIHRIEQLEKKRDAP